MRPGSKHSRNVVESIREEESGGQFASAQHSHPEVSFPKGEQISEPPDRAQFDAGNEFASEPTHEGVAENSTPAGGANGGNFAALHEEHARQVEAIGRERNELARRLADGARELAQARKDHAEELERTRLDRDETIQAKENVSLQLAHVREHLREKSEGFTTERAGLLAERDQLAATLAEWRSRHQTETGALTRDHEELSATLATEREQHHREKASSTAANDQLARERGELSAELDRTRELHRREVTSLTTERDALVSERDAMAGTTAQQFAQNKTEFAALAAQHERMTQERYRISTEFATFRESHDTMIASLTAERDQLREAQVEIRAHIAVVKEGGHHQLEGLRREHAAVLKESDEIHELLETDRLASKKQIELFTAERETLTRERDEALAERIHERQAEEREVELRAQECANLLAQRAEMLGQIEELRASEQRQNALFHEERKILCEERDQTAERLAQSMEALGEDRVTLLGQKTDAEARLDAAVEESAQKIAALEEERVKVAGERDAARRTLAVVEDLQARDLTFLGATAAGKHEFAAATTRDGLRIKCAAKDAALCRQVEIRTIHGGATSDDRRGELIEEARHLARLQHPNIPPIYEAGFDDRGQIFYSTKAVDGMSLRDVLNELERGKMGSLLHFSLRRLLSVFHRVCDALAYAHSLEIAHGDLKPEHIVLGEFGEVFVTGWRPPQTATAEGAAPPEFHPRDDIAGLGRILYEMTTLVPPPEAEASGHDAAVPGRNAPAHAWAGNKDVNALAAIAQRSLDPKLSGRFYSVRELQKQVDTFKDSFDDPARVTLETILRQWIHAHRVALILTAIALVLALAAGFWLAVGPRGEDGGAIPTFQVRDRIELPEPVRPQN